MKTCLSCGKELQDEMPFCPWCGSKFEDIKSSSRAKEITPNINLNSENNNEHKAKAETKAPVILKREIPTTLSKTEFLRNAWIKIFLDNVPNDIFNSDFSNVEVVNSEVCKCNQDVDVSCIAKLGVRNKPLLFQRPDDSKGGIYDCIYIYLNRDSKNGKIHLYDKTQRRDERHALYCGSVNEIEKWTTESLRTKIKIHFYISNDGLGCFDDEMLMRHTPTIYTIGKNGNRAERYSAGEAPSIEVREELGQNLTLKDSTISEYRKRIDKQIEEVAKLEFDKCSYKVVKIEDFQMKIIEKAPPSFTLYRLDEYITTIEYRGKTYKKWGGAFLNSGISGETIGNGDYYDIYTDDNFIKTIKEQMKIDNENSKHIFKGALFNKDQRNRNLISDFLNDYDKNYEERFRLLNNKLVSLGLREVSKEEIRESELFYEINDRKKKKREERNRQMLDNGEKPICVVLENFKNLENLFGPSLLNEKWS